MARIRSVHPGLMTDEAWVSLQPLTRWFGLGLLMEADDNGVFVWAPLGLKMRLLPGDNADPSALLAELEAAKIITRFEEGEKTYGLVRNFVRFQRPKKPMQKHPLPARLRTYAGFKEGEFRTGGELSPQREEGGGRRKEEVSVQGSKEPFTLSSPAKPEDQTRKLKKPPPEIPEDTLYACATVWNELTADVLPSVRDLSPARMKALRARIKDHWARDPVEGFRSFVQRVMRSEFLRGESGTRDWRADFDFVLRPDKAQKILEGGYGIDRPEAA